MSKNNTIQDIVSKEYTRIVKNKYGEKYASWPIISGFNTINGEYGEYIIAIFKHTANNSMTSNSVAVFTEGIIGFKEINDNNKENIRTKIRNTYMLEKLDFVIIARKDGSDIMFEISKMFDYHEVITGEKKMKIFLSHKGQDKTFVREYKSILTEIGFDVWLDEDAMSAGVALHRSIQNGFFDSCAVVFFITDSFIDMDYLEMEINYAITEKLKKKEQFSIITLVFSDNAVVPDLLQPYVWKTPKNDLEGLKEILKALPISVGSVSYK